MPKKRYRRKRIPFRAPELSKAQILAWADDWHERIGRWPHVHSGKIPGSIGENWRKVSNALSLGLRGLPGKSSLARLLAEERGVRNVHGLPRLTVSQILAWADAHFRRTGHWPMIQSGPIPNSQGETWANINATLWRGGRGLPAHSSLARLLAKHRRVRNKRGLPRLTIRRILEWADAHFHRFGAWPTGKSGSVFTMPSEKWSGIEVALQRGSRGLPSDWSLARLLAEHRGKRNRKGLPKLTLGQILRWADDHFAKNGTWPQRKSGLFPSAVGDTWFDIDEALRKGMRGLPGGYSLARLLADMRGVRNRKALPRLRAQLILAWAHAHFLRTGKWPTADSGAVVEKSGETWGAVESALRNGLRGLSGESSLHRLLASHRG